MAEHEETAEIVVRFDQHQLMLLDRLRQEEHFGDTYEEVVVAAFRAYARNKGLLKEADR